MSDRRCSRLQQLVVGTSVEARRTSSLDHSDKLLYSGVITERLANGRYVVSFPDGFVDRGVPREWLRPDSQKTVHEEGGFLVIDGGCFFDGSLDPGPVRLLLSAAAPDIVQSAVAFDEGGWRHDRLAFEQHQFFCLGAVLAQQAMEAEGRRDRLTVCVLGCGGGSVSSGLLAMLPGCQVDTVELDPVVGRLAREHFGFEERAGTSELHIGDAAEYLRRSPDGAFDCVIVDVSGESPEGLADDPWALELPPEPFLADAFLQDLSRVLRRPGGCAVLNVLAGRQRLLELSGRLRRLFVSVHCAATDPNYLFFLRSSPGSLAWDDVLEVVSTADEALRCRRVEAGAEGAPGEVGEGAAAAAAAAAGATPSGIQSAPPQAALSGSLRDALAIIRSTERHAKRRETMGWFSLDDFVALISDPDVTV